MGYSPLGILWVFWVYLNIAYLAQGGLGLFALLLYADDGFLFHVYFFIPYFFFILLPTLIVAIIRAVVLHSKKQSVIKPKNNGVILVTSLMIITTVTISYYYYDLRQLFGNVTPALFIYALSIPAAIATYIRQSKYNFTHPLKNNGKTFSQRFLSKQNVIGFGPTILVVILFSISFISRDVNVDVNKSPIPVADNVCFQLPEPTCIMHVAISLTEQLSDPLTRSRKLFDVGKGFYRIGEQSQAKIYQHRALQFEIENGDPKLRSQKLQTYSLELAKQHDYVAALQAAFAISEKSAQSRRSTSLRYIIKHQLADGDALAALETFELIERRTARWWSLDKIIVPLVQLGKFDDVISLIHKSRDPQDRTKGLFQILLAHAANGDDSDLENQLSQIERRMNKANPTIKPGYWPMQLQRISEAYFSADNQNAGRRYSEMALHVAKTAGESAFRTTLQRQAKTGDMTGVFNTLADTEGLERQKSMINDLVGLSFDDTALDTLERYINTIENDALRDYAYSKFSIYFVYRGDVERSQKLAYSIQDISLQNLSLAKLAVPIAESGNLELGIQLASHNAHNRDRVLSQLSLLGAKAENLVLAFELTKTTDRNSPIIIKLLAEAGEYDHAIKVSQTISDPLEKARSLSNITAELFKAGHITRAATLLREIKSIIHKMPPSRETMSVRIQISILNRKIYDSESASSAEQSYLNWLINGINAKKKNRNDFAISAELFAQMYSNNLFKIIEKFKYPRDRVHILLTTAKFNIRTDNLLEAQKLLHKALDITSNMSTSFVNKHKANRDTKDLLLIEISVLLAKSNNLNEAIETSNKIEHHHNQAKALKAIRKIVSEPHNKMKIIWQIRKIRYRIDEFINYSKELHRASP